MKITIFIIVGLLCMMSVSAANDGVLTGIVLLHDCKAFIKTLDHYDVETHIDIQYANHCEGYVLGVTHASIIWQSAGGQRASICLPENVTLTQIIMVVINHLEKNPKKLHLQADSSVISALNEAFPCK